MDVSRLPFSLKILLENLLRCDDGKFVEFYGEGVAALTLVGRATIANMAPEFGSTCGIFPIDEETVNFQRFSGRSDETADLVEAYAKAQGMFLTPDSPEPLFSDTIALDIGTVVPSLAGPKRPQGNVALSDMKNAWSATRDSLLEQNKIPASDKTKTVSTTFKGETLELGHGDVVIAAITSCTNTSNPSVMLGAGLLAYKAAAAGLQVKPWVKTSLVHRGDRIPAGVRHALVPRGAQLPRGGLWLHDLYRHQRSAASPS